MSFVQRAEVLRDVAHAVHAAHQLGLIHRDLKPANILVEQTADGSFHPYVTDFGLVLDQKQSELTRTGEVLGTPAYMAPEQAEGHADLDVRADVYSLGAVLYHLLTGRPPFDEKSPARLLAHLLEHEPQPPRAVSPQTPKPLEAIALRCLHKARELRYPSALALAEDLDRFVHGQPVLTPGPSWKVQLRARPKLSAALALLGLVAISTGGTALFQVLDHGPQIRRERERIAGIAESTESDLRHAYGLPLHEVRLERSRAAEVVQKLSDGLDHEPPELRGAALLAIGQSELSLHRAEQARGHLRDAWKSGFRGTDVATAWLRADVLVLTQQIDSLDDPGNPNERVARWQRVDTWRRELCSELVPVIIESFPADSVRVGETGSMLALCAGHFPEAQGLARQENQALPNQIDMLRLEALTWCLIAEQELSEGKDLPLAAIESEAASRLDHLASKVAPSDPELYLAACSRWAFRTELGAHSDEVASNHGRVTHKSCEQALIADAATKVPLADWPGDEEDATNDGNQDETELGVKNTTLR
jgi:serine/threonine-protein kinase